MAARKRSIEIYLKEGIEEDDLIFAVWSALRDSGRPQDVFRRMLRVGLSAMVEAGELPRVALSKIDASLLRPTPLATSLMYMAPATTRQPRGRRGQQGAPVATVVPPAQVQAAPAVPVPAPVAPPQTIAPAASEPAAPRHGEVHGDVHREVMASNPALDPETARADEEAQKKPSRPRVGKLM